jgi:TonB family protein
VALREKLGKLVLLEETGSSSLVREYRAARLGPSGLERIVTVLRFSPAVSQDAGATKRLTEEARLAARLQNPGLLRVLGVGRVEQSFYVSTELVEGRTLAAVLERCARESFPFSADHALMVASRAASALEFLHGKRAEAGNPLFHGLVSPQRLLVAFDGEVKLKGLGLWPSLRETSFLEEADRSCLAPEQLAGEPGDARSDVYSLGLVLLHALTLRPPDGSDPVAALAAARLTGAAGDTSPLPAPLAALLRRAMDADPAARFGSVAEMRKAIDTQLFSGDFTPTTFDLAFFMHTLFREDMEREARAIEEERRADYREFLGEEKAAGAAAAAGTATTEPRAAAATDAGPPAHAIPTASEAARDTAEQHAAQVVPPEAASRDASRAREAAAREAAARITFGAAEPARRRGGLLAVLGFVALALAAGTGWLLLSRGRSETATAPATVSPEAEAAMARVRELEGRIAQLEREKAEAETRAAAEARAELEAQAAARGRAVDPDVIQQAEEEARQRARAEQEQRQQAELRRLAEERRTEEQRLAAATPPPTPPPTPDPVVVAPAPAGPVTTSALPGDDAPPGGTTSAVPDQPIPTPEAPALPVTSGEAAPPRDASVPVAADPSEPGVTPPVVRLDPKIRFPPLATARRLAASVVVRALVDEQGRVAEAAVTQPSGHPTSIGFEEAALQKIRGRRYAPARRAGVPVRMWVLVRVDFRP